jgi:hypothetical protein
MARSRRRSARRQWVQHVFPVRVYFGATVGHFYILETLSVVETLGHSPTSESIGGWNRW